MTQLMTQPYGSPASLLFQQLAPSLQGMIQPIDPYSGSVVRGMVNQSQAPGSYDQFMQRTPYRGGVARNSPIHAANAAMMGANLSGQNLMNRVMVPLQAQIQNANNALDVAGQQSQLQQALVGLGDNQYLSDVRMDLNHRNQGVSRLMSMLSPMFNSMLENY